MTATQLLTADHLDLLVTAAIRWRVLTDRTTGAFTKSESHLVVAGAAEAGGNAMPVGSVAPDGAR